MAFGPGGAEPPHAALLPGLLRTALSREAAETRREASVETQVRSWNAEEAGRQGEVRTQVPAGEGAGAGWLCGYWALPGAGHVSWTCWGHASTRLVCDSSWHGSVHCGGHWSGPCCGQPSRFGSWH